MRLSDLLDVDVLGRLAAANYRANGMPIGIVDAVDGAILVGVGWQDICVAYHRVHPETAARCRESDDHIKRHLTDGRPCEYRCRNGLRDIGIPIVVAGEHLATLFMGQFFYDEEAPDRAHFVLQARQFGFDATAYLRALDRVPVFSRQVIENILAYNTVLARFVSELAEASLRQREAAAAAESLGRFPSENPDPILRISEHGEVLYANDPARKRLRPLAIEQGRPAPDEIAAAARRALAEHARITADLRCAEDTFSLSFVPGAGIVNVYGHEVTSRLQAEEALRRGEAHARARAAELEAILDSVGDGVIVYDDEGRTIRSTPSADRILGVPLDERRSPVQQRVNSQYEVFTEDGRRLGPEEMAAYRASVRGETIRGEVIRIRRGGSERWIRINATPLALEGRHAGAVLSLTDITEGKVAEETLRESEERFRALADNIAQLAWMADDTGSLSWYNQRWFDYTGTTLDEMQGWGWQKVHHPDHVARVTEKFKRHVASGERWEDTFPLRGRDGQYRWFLSRAIPIRNARGNVVRWFGTNTDVTEQRAAEEALREADRRKDEFLGMLSHELRNPLAPIRNSVYLLRHVDPGTEQARRAHVMIERQTEHLTRLVDDLLDVTRIARGKIQIRRERIDLRDVLVRAAEDFRLTFGDRGVSFRTELPHATVWADADPTRLTQVVGNLLHNAAKFTRKGDEVVLSLRADGGDAEIRVRDTGAGIDAALLPSVFEPFVQGERTLARTEGGLGLGLALVKGVALLHGGNARVESAGKGRGAEFTIRMPILAPEISATAALPPTRRSTRSRRILVVDDNPDAAESLADIVRLLGHEVEIAWDGPSAVERARATRPDVVLCDVGLPGIDGYEVARTLRASGCGEMQLIAVSGYAQPEDVRKAVEAGFDAHVAKPPDPAQIERLIE